MSNLACGFFFFIIPQLKNKEIGRQLKPPTLIWGNGIYYSLNNNIHQPTINPIHVVAQNGAITVSHDHSFITGICSNLKNGRLKLSKYIV